MATKVAETKIIHTGMVQEQLDRRVKLLRPGRNTAVEMWMRNGYRLYAAAAVQLSGSLRLQNVDAVPQYVASTCMEMCPTRLYGGIGRDAAQHLGAGMLRDRRASAV